MSLFLNGYNIDNPDYINLANHSDIHDISKNGNYKYSGGTIVNNVPSNKYGTFFVRGNNQKDGPRRTLIFVSDDGEECYIQTLSGTTWSKWNKIAFQNTIDELNQRIITIENKISGGGKNPS